MQNKKPYDMHYKKDDTGITVTRPGRFRLRFDGATSARHEKKRYISVVINLGLYVSVDEYGIKHYK